MVQLYHWQSATATALTMGMAAAMLPLIMVPLMATPSRAETAPRMAQLLQQRLQYRLPAGTVIPVRYDEAERIILKPDETVDVTLIVAADVRSPSTNRVVIPAGSTITGELRPEEAGTQFVSETITLRQERLLDDGEEAEAQAIDAVSDVITDTQVITEESDPDILRGAAIGAAAAAVLSEIFGSIDVIEVLGGAGLGALAEILLSGSEEVEVVVIEPATDLDLTLQSEFDRDAVGSR
jgi:hypothetical protein